MAPVEPARAAAVVVVAVVGVIVAAFAVVRFKSKSKKKEPEDHSEKSSTTDSKSTTKIGTRVKESQSKSTSEETISPDTSANIPSQFTTRQPVESVKPKAGEQIPEKRVKDTNLEETGLLVKQVYKADDEPTEQTIVSFAEIQFSPSKSEENSASDIKLETKPAYGASDKGKFQTSSLNLSLSGGLLIGIEPESFETVQPEQSTSFEAISVSSICREEGDSDNGQKDSKKNEKNGQNSDGSTSENSKSDTSFETVEVGQDGSADWAEPGKSVSTFKPSETGEISSVQLPPDLIAQAAGAGPAIGAGESLALSLEGGGDESSIGIAGSVPAESAGDASFVLLDVATAPSNCKPDVVILDPAPLSLLDLQLSVSLERLKSAGSDQHDDKAPAPHIPSTKSAHVSAEPDPFPDLTEADICDSLDTASDRPERLELKHAQTLVRMLSTKDLEVQQKILDVITTVAAFTKNQDTLRDCGCIPKLTKLLKSHSMAAQAGVLPLPALLNSLIKAVTNLAVNATNNAVMQECALSLIDLILSPGNESVQMVVLLALTNLSVTADHHGLYTRAIQQLYDLVDSAYRCVQLQSLKVMVNLSCNKNMIPHLLAAKAPSCWLSLLEMDTTESAVLRWATLLANIMHTVKDSQMSSSELPSDDKAASPETMYIALYGVNTTGQLRNKVFVLSRHRNEDIRYQAARIYSGLMK